MKKLCSKNNYDIVHCHSPIGGMIARFACRRARKKRTRVIYTAHGFHFYKGAPLRNWLIYYTAEKIAANFTDTLITINKEDYNRAKKKFRVNKVEYVPGVGLDLNKFKKTIFDKKLKLQELNIPQNSFVIMSVGELNKNKNHEVVIRAISEIANPNIHYIICGEGNLEKHLRDLSKLLGIEKQVHLLGFRKDIHVIHKVSDLFVFPSLREGLSVALMEAMGSGLPIVCSEIRGNIDLVQEKQGACYFHRRIIAN